MVLIEHDCVRSAAIYCIKNDSGLKSFFAFYSICLLFAGIYGILKKDLEDFCSTRAKGCVCSPAYLPTEKIVKFCA